MNIQRKHIVLLILVAAVVVAVAATVDPALAAPKKGKDPAQAGHDFAKTVTDFFLPVALMVTAISAGFDGFNGRWGGFFSKIFLGGVVVVLLVHPDKFQSFMERFVTTITG